jgi:hypothetical protein
MKINQCLLFILILAMSCRSPANKPTPNLTFTAADTTKMVADTTKAASQPDGPPKNDTVAVLKTHLRDTTFVAGNFILFLRPDDARYAELNNDPDNGAGEGDADFRVGISNTEDSVLKNSKYKDIKVLISTSRYICIKDCKDGPLVIDRDSVNCGYILSRQGHAIASSYNSVHSGDYLGELNEYFSMSQSN